MPTIKAGGFFITFFAKAVTKSSKLKNEKLKNSIFDGLSNLYKKFSELYCSFSNNTVAEIMNLIKTLL